jgi:exonuclease SbcC
MLPSERHAEATACRDALDDKEQAARTLHAAAESDLAAVSSTRPDDEPADAVASERLSVLATASAETNAALEALLQSTAVKDTRIASDDAARVAAAGRAEALAMAKAERDEWDIVHKLIGLGDGARFATVVQALQLQQVLLHANENLARFMPRYALEQVFHKEAGPLLDFRVVDTDQQGGVRSIQSLSGGESFVVSLALALGLAAIRSSRLRIETLLIDEGFGSLDPATLALAHQALQSLQGAAGVQIGIISHVGTLKELIAAQIVVEPTGAGASRIRHGDAQRGSDGGPDGGPDGDPDGDPDDASTGRPAA